MKKKIRALVRPQAKLRCCIRLRYHNSKPYTTAQLKTRRLGNEILPKDPRALTERLHLIIQTSSSSGPKTHKYGTNPPHLWLCAILSPTPRLSFVSTQSLLLQPGIVPKRLSPLPRLLHKRCIPGAIQHLRFLGTPMGWRCWRWGFLLRLLVLLLLHHHHRIPREH